ncbi:MAG: hypothetical protein LUG60_00320 [Erysipelotrichaceae bacterium]|nr:hypothetical protein [Erysipelotrichaceae bacterium]
MAIKEAYKYINFCIDNGNAKFDNLDYLKKFVKCDELIQTQTINVSYNVEWLFPTLRLDLIEYDENEPTWICMKYYDDLLVPYDYLLIDYDLYIDDDNVDIYFETTLKIAKTIFEIVNEI